MNRAVIAGLTALALIAPSWYVAGTPVQEIAHRRWHRYAHKHEDNTSALDVWIASRKASLKLSPEQEKYWPPVERVLRDILSVPEERREGLDDRRNSDDAIANFRDRANGMAQTSATLNRLADATEPLYRTLSGEQQRRFHAMLGIRGWRYRHRQHRHRF
jgi:hypothetical protein